MADPYEMQPAQSQRAEKLSKSSEINVAWQIGASGSDWNERQDGGLSEVMLNNASPGQIERMESRIRTYWLGYRETEESEESDGIDYGDCQNCGEVLHVYDFYIGNPSSLLCRNCRYLL